MMQPSQHEFGHPGTQFDTASVRLEHLHGARPWVNGFMRVLSGTLAGTALGIWLLPIGSGSTAEVLCKLAISLVLGYAAGAAWNTAKPAVAPELEIDMVQRELRVVHYNGEDKQSLVSCRFSELGAAAFDGRDVKLWDQSNGLLAAVSLPNEQAVNMLRDVLQDSDVKLPLAA